jgi:hypothetical protein
MNAGTTHIDRRCHRVLVVTYRFAFGLVQGFCVSASDEANLSFLVFFDDVVEDRWDADARKKKIVIRRLTSH